MKHSVIATLIFINSQIAWTVTQHDLTSYVQINCQQFRSNNTSNNFSVLYPVAMTTFSPIFIEWKNQHVHNTNFDGSYFLDYYIGENQTIIQYHLDFLAIRDSNVHNRSVGQIKLSDCDQEGNNLEIILDCRKP